MWTIQNIKEKKFFAKKESFDDLDIELFEAAKILKSEQDKTTKLIFCYEISACLISIYLYDEIIYDSVGSIITIQSEKDIKEFMNIEKKWHFNDSFRKKEISYRVPLFFDKLEKKIIEIFKDFDCPIKFGYYDIRDFSGELFINTYKDLNI